MRTRPPSRPKRPGRATAAIVDDALRAEHAFVTALLDSTNALIVVLDRGGRYVRFNEAAERASGYRSEEVVGRALWELGLLPADELEGVSAVFERLRAGEASVPWVNHWIHRDGGRRLIAWSNTLLRDAGGEISHLISTGIDVTEQRAVEDALRIRTEELELLHRKYVASRLAAMVVHEVNQPLAAIAGYAGACLQAIGAAPAMPKSVVRNLEKISEQALRAGSFINGLRRLMANASPDLRPENLNALVRTACELTAPLARRSHVRLVFDLDHRLRPVKAASIQIEHVVVNLVRNAIEALAGAAPKSGEIVITTRAASARMAQVTVADNGPGLAPEAAEAAFERPFSTKDAGIGMGLSICRTLVEAHGGRIRADPGQGATFHFTLPFAA